MADSTKIDLYEVAHAANDALFDVSAILTAARLALKSKDMNRGDIERVIRQAVSRVEQIQRTFDPHI